MNEIKIIALIVMILTGINIIWRIIKGAMNYAAWKRGITTDEEDSMLAMRNSKSLMVGGIIPFIIALIIFLVA